MRAIGSIAVAWIHEKRGAREGTLDAARVVMSWRRVLPILALVAFVAGFSKTTTDAYDENANTWTSRAAPPTQQIVGAALGADGRIYTVGDSLGVRPSDRQVVPVMR